MRICFAFLLLCCSGCTHFAQDRWTGRDKAQHFISSAFFAAAGNSWGEHQQWSAGQSASFGLLFSLSLGVGKELYDSRAGGTGWSWKDLAWDVAGASAGYALWNHVR